MTDQEQFDKALNLLERCNGLLEQRTWSLRNIQVVPREGWSEMKTKLTAALWLLEGVRDYVVDRDNPHDATWLPEYVALTGDE